ncbi:hypothetical protein GCM10010191_54230 [Actinomadura vinacea]|uniref:DUF397 domain-containing protein n=1 Tax=Actinomadura vinacea TaxID=115336 RepID=A0ABP5WQ51_9ACTN
MCIAREAVGRRAGEDGRAMEVINWRKSSHSGPTGGECIEVASLPGVIAVRDSKDPDGPKLALDQDAFGTFLARLKQQ